MGRRAETILANAEYAVVDITKLRDYSLNPAHVEGKHKARVFASLLGFTAADAEKLRQMILTANPYLRGKTRRYR